MDVNKNLTKPKMSAAVMNHTPAKTKVTKLVSTLEKDLAEKDEYNQSLEAQVKVLNDLMRNMAGEVVDRESDIENLKKVLVIKNAAIGNLEAEVENYKQDALEHELKAKVSDEVDAEVNAFIVKQKAHIAALKTSEKLATSLYKQQQVLVNTLLAMVNKERKVEFIMGGHKLSRATTAPTEKVRSEMELSAKRNRREEESEYISRMCKKVDELAAQYNSDRYNANKSINLSMPSSTPDPTNLPSSVPEELFAIWLFQEGLTPDEEERYDRFLRQQMRPPLVKSPPLQQPRVNWNRLNPGQYKNLPQPVLCPVQSCSPDPMFYEKEVDVYISQGQGSMRKYPAWGRTEAPFGKMYGFSTNMGTVAVPDVPVHGYRCCHYSGTWQIDAGG